MKSEMLSNTQTHTRTDTQTKNINPRCACAPRVNSTTGSKQGTKYVLNSYCQLQGKIRILFNQVVDMCFQWLINY